MVLYGESTITDSERFWSLVGRYYDPSTDQFLSIDPDVAETGQPYAYTADDPLNATDPLGLTKIGNDSIFSFSIQSYGSGYATRTHVSTKFLVHALKHIPSLSGFPVSELLQTVKKTLKDPTDITPQSSKGTLKYVARAEVLTSVYSDSGVLENQYVKKAAAEVAINQTNGNLVTAWVTTQDKSLINQVWSQSSWKSRN
jgi:RHS repeat-associated protein